MGIPPKFQHQIIIPRVMDLAEQVSQREKNTRIINSTNQYYKTQAEQALIQLESAFQSYISSGINKDNFELIEKIKDLIEHLQNRIHHLSQTETSNKIIELKKPESPSKLQYEQGYDKNTIAVKWNISNPVKQFLVELNENESNFLGWNLNNIVEQATVLVSSLINKNQS